MPGNFPVSIMKLLVVVLLTLAVVTRSCADTTLFLLYYTKKAKTAVSYIVSYLNDLGLFLLSSR